MTPGAAPVAPRSPRPFSSASPSVRVGRAIELRLSHDDLGTLAEASAELQAQLRRYSWAYNVADDMAPGRPELRLSLRDGAGALGLDARAVADQVRAAFQGVTADEIQAGAETWEVDVRLASADRDAAVDLESFMLQTPTGA